MDALYHFILSIAGCFLLVEGLRIKYRTLDVFIVSIISMLPDLQHVIEYLGVKRNIEMHGLYIAFAPLVIYLILLYLDAFKNKRNYLLILSVLLFGHLVMDTVSGINGVVLFYPFSHKEYLMPKSWEVDLFNDSDKPLASTYGIGLAIYFGLIGLIILIHSQLSSRASLRKTASRR